MNILFTFWIVIGVARDPLPGFPVERYLIDTNADLKVAMAKKVIQTEYKFADDSVVLNKEIPIQEFWFSDTGRLSKIYSQDGKNGNRLLSYEFDVEGRIYYHRKEDGIFIYSSDDKARISKEFYYNRDSALVETTVARYDPKNKLIKKEIYRSDSKLSRYWIYIYNTHGDLTNEVFVNTNNGVRIGGATNSTLLPGDTTIYRYSYGDTTRTSRMEKEVIKELTKEFKKQDTLVSQRFLFSKKIHALAIVSESKMIGKWRTDERKVSTWHKYVIEDGLLMKYINYDNTRIIRQDRYQYIREKDNHGNWTSLVTELNGVKTRKTERLIEY